jgi:hypothetical protein
MKPSGHVIRSPPDDAGIPADARGRNSEESREWLGGAKNAQHPFPFRERQASVSHSSPGRAALLLHDRHVIAEEVRGDDPEAATLPHQVVAESLLFEGEQPQQVAEARAAPFPSGTSAARNRRANPR